MSNLRVRPPAVREVLSSVWNHPANADQRLRAVARNLRFQARGRFAGRSTVVPFGQRSRVIAHLDESSSHRAVEAPLPDHPEMLVWLRTLQPGDLFVDVGANIGLYSVLAAECGAEVIAFEPGVGERRQLEANLAVNGYEAEVIAAAAADHAGAGADDVVIDLRTLDEVLGDRVAAGVKIDVEGAARLVLAGGSHALLDGRLGLIQLEWDDTSMRHFGETREPVQQLLEAAGYELCRPDATGTLWPVRSPEVGADVFARRVIDLGGWRSSGAE